MKDLNSLIEEKIKEFDKNYCEFTDQGTLIIPIGENGIPIEDFLRQSLTSMAKEAKEQGYNQGIYESALQYGKPEKLSDQK